MEHSSSILLRSQKMLIISILSPFSLCSYPFPSLHHTFTSSTIRSIVVYWEVPILCQPLFFFILVLEVQNCKRYIGVYGLFYLEKCIPVLILSVEHIVMKNALHWGMQDYFVGDLLLKEWSQKFSRERKVRLYQISYRTRDTVQRGEYSRPRE